MQLLSRRGSRPDDRAVLHELPCRGLLDGGLQADARKISIVRWWKDAARGWIAVPRWRSTSRCGTPWSTSRAEVVSPDEAAADDEDGDVALGHGGHCPVSAADAADAGCTECVSDDRNSVYVYGLSRIFVSGIVGVHALLPTPPRRAATCRYSTVDSTARRAAAQVDADQLVRRASRRGR